MAYDAHVNFGYSTVLTAPSPASSGTSLTVQSGDGTKFPAASFNATVWPAGAQPTTANAEIVRVTAISTDTFTITRAQESSNARSIVGGDQIAAGITVKDLTDIETAFPNGAWTTYTPTLANVTAGNGTLTANYQQYGKTVLFKFRFVLGSTSSITGSPTVTLPVTSTSFYSTFSGMIGLCDLVHTGVQDYGGFLRLNSTTVAGLLVIGTNGSTTAISSTVPFTFGTGDQLVGQATYEAA